MTLFYVATFALLFLRPRWQAWLVRFGPAGRMALSVYVSQTVVGALIFFGCGPRSARPRRQQRDHGDGPGRVRTAGLGFSRLADSLPFRAARVGVAIAHMVPRRALRGADSQPPGLIVQPGVETWQSDPSDVQVTIRVFADPVRGVVWALNAGTQWRPLDPRSETRERARSQSPSVRSVTDGSPAYVR